MGHTHHCVVCKQQIAVCDGPLESCSLDVDRDADGEPILGDDKKPLKAQHCSVHHPHPAHRVEDKPVVRMTVRIVDDKNGRQSDVP